MLIEPLRFMTMSGLPPPALSLPLAALRRPARPVEPDRALVARLERGLLGDARRRAADVERPHRQLRAGLADRLRRDDADRQAELDQPARSPGRGRSTSRTRRGARRT